jgi:PRTRC genetic system protein B
MNEYELKNAVEQQLSPEMALIVYKNEKGNEIYLESHPINAHGKMLAGKPLTLKCITELVESFSIEQSNVPHGKVPVNMLYSDTRKGHERFVWYNPPQKRMMFFKADLNIKDREYYLPGFIYDTNGEYLDMYAFKDNKLEGKSKLYKVPLFNVTNQKVCLGSAKLNFPENPTFSDLITYWEKKFWLTEFSHLGGSVNPTKTNLVTVTKNSTESFDLNELVPFKNKNKTLTLNDIVK